MSDGWEERGRRIRSARRDAGLTVEALSVALGRNRDTVYRWEQGRSSPTVDELLRIAQLTGRPSGYFLSEAAA